MRSDLARVRVRLLWWGGSTGRLVLVRTVDHAELGTCEVWWSNPVGEDEVAAAELLLHPDQWRHLLSGLPVPRFDLPIPLYRVSEEDDSDDRQALGEALGRPDFHQLCAMHTLTHTDVGETVVLAADPPALGSHRLARPLGAHIEPAPDIFARLTEQAPAARAEYDVTLSDVRGVMIGDDNQQINHFDITVRDPEFDLDSVLARPGVQRAIAEVTMNPADEGRRTALIDALTRPGWFVSWHPARLTVTDPGEKQSAGFLAGLLGFNVDVMVGDGNRQTNHFTYVTSSLPEAQDMLAGNRTLARAVAGLICPDDATTDVVTLWNAVGETVRGMPVDFDNGRIQAAKLEPHALMSLVRVDGAMVGDGGGQEVNFDVNLDRRGRRPVRLIPRPEIRPPDKDVIDPGGWPPRSPGPPDTQLPSPFGRPDRHEHPGDWDEGPGRGGFSW